MRQMHQSQKYRQTFPITEQDCDAFLRLKETTSLEQLPVGVATALEHLKTLKLESTAYSIESTTGSTTVGVGQSRLIEIEFGTADAYLPDLTQQLNLQDFILLDDANSTRVRAGRWLIATARGTLTDTLTQPTASPSATDSSDSTSDFLVDRLADQLLEVSGVATLAFPLADDHTFSANRLPAKHYIEMLHYGAIEDPIISDYLRIGMRVVGFKIVEEDDISRLQLIVLGEADDFLATI